MKNGAVAPPARSRRRGRRHRRRAAPGAGKNGRQGEDPRFPLHLRRRWRRRTGVRGAYDVNALRPTSCPFSWRTSTRLRGQATAATDFRLPVVEEHSGEVLAVFSRGRSVVACLCSNALLQCRAHFVDMRHACHILLRQLPSTLPHAYNQYVTKGSTNLHAFCYRFEQKRREGGWLLGCAYNRSPGK